MTVVPAPVGADHDGDAKARAVGGARAMAIRHVVVGLISLAGTTVLIRSLGPAPWASFTVAYFLVVFIDQSVATRLLGHVIRAPRLSAREPATAAAVGSAAGALILVAALLGSGPAADAYGRDDLRSCLLAVGVCGAVYAWRATSTALAERRLDYASIAIADVLDQVCFYVVALIAIAAGGGIEGVALALALRGIPPALFLRRRHPSPLLGRWDGASGRRLLAFGAPSVAAAGVILADGLVPLIALGGENAVELAFFMTCSTIAGYGAMVAVVTQRVGLPALATVQDDPARFEHFARRVLDLTNLAVLSAVGPLVASAPLWLPVLLGSEWERAGAVIVLAGAGLVVSSFVHAAAASLAPLGHARDTLALNAWMTAVYAVLALLLVAGSPLLACPVAYLASRVAGLPLVVLLVRRRGVGLTWLPAFWRLCGATGAFVTIGLLVDDERVLAAALLAAPAIALWLLVNRHDLAALRGAARRGPAPA